MARISADRTALTKVEMKDYIMDFQMVDQLDLKMEKILAALMDGQMDLKMVSRLE